MKFLSWVFLTWGTGVTNSPTNRFFSSVDVTFFKDTPLFSIQVEPDSRSQVLSLPYLSNPILILKSQQPLPNHSSSLLAYSLLNSYQCHPHHMPPEVAPFYSLVIHFLLQRLHLFQSHLNLQLTYLWLFANVFILPIIFIPFIIIRQLCDIDVFAIFLFPFLDKMDLLYSKYFLLYYKKNKPIVTPI